MEGTELYRLEHPSVIYLESTTRCNLSCEMCVKQSSGGEITEEDFNPGMISSIEPVLPYISTLILSGIGEPLLYPHLEELIHHASKLMNTDSRIGFQTNGMLVTEEKARSLIRAGLNLVCVSMDASTPEAFKTMRKGGEISDAENAILLFREESRNLGKKQV